MARRTKSYPRLRSGDLSTPCRPSQSAAASSPGTRMGTTCCCAISKARSWSRILPVGSWHPERRYLPVQIVLQSRHFYAPTSARRWPAAEPVDPWRILQLLALLVLANGAPVAAKKVLGERFAYPLDGGAAFVDGRPLFGQSKTIRGVVFAVLAATIGAPLVGLEWQIGFLVGSLAMAGDLTSSF